MASARFWSSVSATRCASVRDGEQVEPVTSSSCSAWALEVLAIEREHARVGRIDLSQASEIGLSLFGRGDDRMRQCTMPICSRIPCSLSSF